MFKLPSSANCCAPSAGVDCARATLLPKTARSKIITDRSTVFMESFAEVQAIRNLFTEEPRIVPLINRNNMNTSDIQYHFASQLFVFGQKLASAEKSTSSFAAPFTELKTSRVEAADGNGTPN